MTKSIIPEERRNNIVDFLNKNKTATIENLKDFFNVSEITIRRDLYLLEQKGLIEKVYGGARSKKQLVSEIIFLKQLNKMVDEKKRIAIECAKRIHDGMTVVIHGGSTCLEIAKNLNNKKNLKIVTCSPSIVSVLWDLSIKKYLGFDIYCPGGKLQISPYFFTGKHSAQFFNNINIDIAFIGVIALNIEEGFMTTKEDEAELLLAIINSSKKIIAPTDHSKFTKSAFIKVGSLKMIDEIITDCGLKDEIYNKFIKKNIIITRV